MSIASSVGYDLTASAIHSAVNQKPKYHGNLKLANSMISRSSSGLTKQAENIPKQPEIIKSAVI